MVYIQATFSNREDTKEDFLEELNTLLYTWELVYIMPRYDKYGQFFLQFDFRKKETHQARALEIKANAALEIILKDLF